MSVGSPGETCVTTEELIEAVQEHIPSENLKLIKDACVFAEKHYAGLNHPTGKSHIHHAFSIAKYLAETSSEVSVVAAAVLCPPPSVQGKVLDVLRRNFRSEDELLRLVEEVLQISRLEWSMWPLGQVQKEARERREILQKMFLLAVDGVNNDDLPESSLVLIPFQKREKQLENLIRMFLAMATDIRALVIKLVDHLLFIKDLKNLSPSQQQSINYKLFAKIGISIYAPLADRLGMWRLKSELEDMSFRLLKPDKYMTIAKQLADKKEVRKQYIDQIIPIIRAKLVADRVEAEIYGRAKHIYSIYKKMESKQLTFNEINDLLGIRIIVDKEEDCYRVQSILHEHWQPITEVYDGKAGRDWIANPKENLYQSLHTTILIAGKAVEVQIRTRRMHEIAEYGVTALKDAVHWRYKESKAYRKAKNLRETGSRERSKQLVELRKILSDEHESTISMVRDLLEDRIFVITPEGHVIDLPARATPLDFAYRIHTNLGHTYTGAKVGCRLVHADYELKNGDIVEILTSRTRKGPNPEWLSKSRLDDELKTSESIEFLISGEGPLPQWLYKREEGNKSREKGGSESQDKDNTISKDVENYMYYVFARTRQARSKIQSWLNKHDEEQKSKHNDAPKPKNQK